MLFGVLATQSRPLRSSSVTGEFDETVGPFEAGSGFMVALDEKNEGFVGRAALERTQGAQRRALVGLAFETSELVAHAGMVFSSKQVQAGIITSACFSPRTGTTLAMARLAIEHAGLGIKIWAGNSSHQPKMDLTMPVYPNGRLS